MKMKKHIWWICRNDETDANDEHENTWHDETYENEENERMWKW